MITSAIVRAAIIVGAAAVLSACATTGQPPSLGSAGLMTMPQVGSRASWILPVVKDRRYLLYVAELAGVDSGVVNIYAVRSANATLVGQLALPNEDAGGVCSDRRGNVYVVYGNRSGKAGEIDEYAPGASKVKQRLRLKGYLVTCAVDRTTGNIAVAILATGYDKIGGIYLISGGLKKGHYTFLSDRHGLQAMWDDTYDARGNLFIRGKRGSSDGLDELPAGTTQFVHLTGLPLDDEATVGWDGKYVTVGDDFGSRSSVSFTVDEITVAGSTITVAHSTTFTDSACSYGLDMPKALVRGTIRARNTLVSVNANCPNRVGFWNYANGGEPKRAWTNANSDYPSGEAISAAKT